MDYTSIISARQLAEIVNKDGVRVFDCRFALKDPQGGLKSYQSGHIPGAQFADMDTQLSSPMTETSGRHPLPAEETFLTQLRDWGVSNSTQVIAYDDISGAFAARMWWLLRWMGHTRVAVLDGGLQQWTEAGLALSQDDADYPPSKFSGRANMNWVLDIDAVRAELAEDNLTLIDARAADRFTGKDQQTDPIPGHVPGANNLPFGGNLTNRGVFAAPEVIRQRFKPLVDAKSIEQVANMCGSGVTACHNLLAMEIAGYPPTRLFVGSWSQWIRDQSRPVAIGDS